MLEDWRNVDLNSITKQTLYTMEDTRDEHRKLIIQCKMLHQGVCLSVCLKRKSMLVNKVAFPPCPPWDPIPPVPVKRVGPGGGASWFTRPWVHTAGENGFWVIGQDTTSGRRPHTGPSVPAAIPWVASTNEEQSLPPLSAYVSLEALDMLPALPWRVTGVSPPIGRWTCQSQ